MEKINEEIENLEDRNIGIMLDDEMSILRIGDNAPNFTASSTDGTISLNDFRGRWVVLFSHPRRFYTCLHY